MKLQTPVLFAAVALVCGLSLGACAAAAEQGEGPAQSIISSNPAGHYRRIAPSRADLIIERAGLDWRVEIVAAGIPRGGGTASDCASVGVGPEVHGQITAQLVPFHTENGELEAADLENQPGRLVVRLGARTVEVVSSDGERFCGLGSMLTGVYRKVG